MKNSVVHKFRTPYNYYIYDLGTNYIAEINKELYHTDFLENSNSVSPESADILNTLFNIGLFSTNIVTTIEHQETEFLDTLVDRNVTALILQLTQQCNLRCHYCIYSGNYDTRGHQNRKMTFELAKKSIDFLIAHSVESPYLSIGFYGGEPLLEYKLIKKCIEYVNIVADGRNILYNITTNATLLTDEIIEYCVQKDINLTISLDGDKDTQDKNRVFASDKRGTFDIIVSKLDKIKTKYPEYYEKVMFNVVLDSDGNFNSLNDFFTNHPIVRDSIVKSTFINHNYSKQKMKMNEQFKIDKQYELFKLYLNKLNYLHDYKASKILAQEFDIIKNVIADREVSQLLPEKSHHGGPCVPGVQRLFVDVDGNLYPCERVSEKSTVMRIGNIEDGFDLEKINEILNIGKITSEYCKKCWAFRFCGLCAAYADGITQLDAKKKLSNCNSIRKTTEYNMKVYMMLNEFSYDFNKS